MNLPKVNLQAFMTLPVALVACVGAVGTILNWSGHSVVSHRDMTTAQVAQQDSLHKQIVILLNEVKTVLADERVLNEAQIRGECLENSLEILARQGLLNSCQDRGLLIGRTITPAVEAAAAAARPDSTP